MKGHYEQMLDALCSHQLNVDRPGLLATELPPSRVTAVVHFGDQSYMVTIEPVSPRVAPPPPFNEGRPREGDA